MKLEYLITGTPRSGTVFSARLLTSVGLPCGHESVFDWKGIDSAVKRLAGEEPLELSYASRTRFDHGQWHDLENWLPDLGAIVAESSYMAAPYLNHEVLSGVPVIHVVRNPVKMVNSICNYIGYFWSDTPTNCYENFIYEHVPELSGKMSQYDRACLFWVRWNRMVKSDKIMRLFRVEDDPQTLIEAVGGSGDPFRDKTINSYKKPTDKRFTIDRIESSEIRSQFCELGKQYGYPMLSEYLMI